MLEDEVDKLRREAAKNKETLQKKLKDVQDMKEEYENMRTELSKANVALGERKQTVLEDLAQSDVGRQVIFATVAKLVEEYDEKHFTAAKRIVR